MKYLAYTADTGAFNGWYDDTIHKTIPSPSIQISDADYQSYFTTLNSGKHLTVVGGKITFTDQVIQVTWDEIRTERNALLTASDYTQMPDNELSADKQQEWKEYRQILRRIPEAFSSPSEVVWPTKPA